MARHGNTFVFGKMNRYPFRCALFRFPSKMNLGFLGTTKKQSETSWRVTNRKNGSEGFCTFSVTEIDETRPIRLVWLFRVRSRPPSNQFKKKNHDFGVSVNFLPDLLGLAPSNGTPGKGLHPPRMRRNSLIRNWESGKFNFLNSYQSLELSFLQYCTVLFSTVRGNAH